MIVIKLSGHTNTSTEANNLIDELYERSEIQNQQQYRNAPDKFYTKEMELPSKLLKQIASKTRPETEELMLIVLNKSTHEENLSQPSQTKYKLFKGAITYLSDFKRIFNVTNSNNKSISKSVIEGAEHNLIRIHPGDYEFENSNNKIKQIIIARGHIAAEDYPPTNKPYLSTLGSIVEIEPGTAPEQIVRFELIFFITSRKFWEKWQYVALLPNSAK